MKKMRLFFGLLICAFMLFSCNKPNEGDDPGTWMATDSIHLVGACTVTGDLDLAVYTITLNPAIVHADQVRLEKVELLYRMGIPMTDSAAWDNAKHVNILRDTVLNSVYYYTDTLWNLIPGKTYSYRLVMSDEVFSDTTSVKSFQTLNVEKPRVTIDTVFLSAGMVKCQASVNAHWRSMLDEFGYTLSLFCGTDAFSLDQEMEQVEVVYDTLMGNTLKRGFQGSVALGADTSLWFRAYVKDSWDQEAWSDTVNYVISDQPYAAIVKHERLGPVSYRLKGNAVQGNNDVSLYRCGFCYGTTPYPTVNSMVVEATPAQWGAYSCVLSELAYSTTYYYRAFLQITDEYGPVYYSSNIGQFITDTQEAPLSVEMIDLADIYTNPLIPIPLMEQTRAYVLAKVENGALSDVREYGFVWKKRIEGDNDNEVTLENCLGSVNGLDASQLPPTFSILPGLPDLTNAFFQQLTDMESGTEYWVGAYAKMGGGVVIYSPGISLKMLSE